MNDKSPKDKSPKDKSPEDKSPKDTENENGAHPNEQNRKNQDKSKRINHKREKNSQNRRDRKRRRGIGINLSTLRAKNAWESISHANTESQRMGSQRIVRIVVGVMLSFAFAIALPFVAPRALFPDSMMLSEDSAPVVVDGRALFRVTDTISTASASARARTISEGLQKFAQAEQRPEIKIAIPDTTTANGLATVWLGYPSLENPQDEDATFDFTVTAGDTTDSLTPARQAQIWARQLRSTFKDAQQQRQDSYIRTNLWQVLIVPLLAVLAHWLAGIVWCNYLSHFMHATLEGDPSAAFKDRPKGREALGQREQFTTVSLFLNATLLLLRLGIWIGALLYATNLFPDTRQVSYRIISALNESFTKDTVPLGNNPVSILDIFRVLILVLLVTIIARILSNVLKRRVLQETGINRGVQEAISILIRYSLIIVGCIVVLQASGIDLSSLTLLASALGVGAGLGLQNIVKDVGSGLVLVFERPVQVGEFVQIGEQSGTVERIGTRSVEIRTLDQVSIIVPNSQFLESKVVNWSHRNPISRIRIPVGVSYNSDPEQVRDLLLQVSRQHSDVLATPPASVLFQAFGDSALTFDLLVWIAQPSRQFIIKSDLMFMISKALRTANIEIPFPQRDIHIIRDLTTDQLPLSQEKERTH
ncbi:MAG: mechanosensitive ion channel family protein [Phormidesmis sp.]